MITPNHGRCILKAKVFYLKNLSPEKFLVCGLHEGGELNLVSSGHVDCHLVQVAVGLEKKIGGRILIMSSRIAGPLQMIKKFVGGKGQRLQ